MAMLQMQRIYIYALKKDRKPLLEMLQRRGVLEINDAVPEDDVFCKADVSQARSGFERNINAAGEAVEILDRYVSLKKSMFSSFRGKKEVSAEEYGAFKARYERTMDTAVKINAYEKEITELKAEILKLEAQAQMLAPWAGLDIPLGFTGTRFTKGFIGTLPKEWTSEKIYEALAQFMPVNVDVISASGDQTCIFVLCAKDRADGVYEALRSLDFSHPGISSDKAPVEQSEVLDKRITQAREGIKIAEDAIIASAGFRDDLLFLQDYDCMRQEKYEMIGRLSQSRNIFVLTGYVPERDAKALETALNKSFTVAVETEQPAEEEDAPVLLSNNGFARPLEWVVESFSLPGRGEIDPTPIMAFFYYLLFGIIMADAGYGALIVATCGLLLLKYGKKMEAFMNNFLTMFFYCGISSVFWGIMFGSYFGDLPDVIAGTFFGAEKLPLIQPLWFVPMNQPMRMLAFSMGLGIIHLLTGLVMKAIQLIRQKDYIAIIYDAVSWFVLVISCTAILLSLDMIKTILGLTIAIPKRAVTVCAIAALAAALIIIATNGRESRNPLKRFLKGVYALYGISGYLSDVLSYSRLLALGLASGVICSVVNKMAGMASDNIVGPLIFTIIVLFGHTLNFAISILGAYVHTNRLQYVEFFGKFYGGGGRSFNPFNMKTKYYKVKESIKNEI
jgi:V/A-type H+-transporting ATPase subunit I